MSMQIIEIQEITEKLIIQVLEEAMKKQGGLKIPVSKIGTRFLASPQPIPVLGKITTVILRPTFLGFAVEHDGIQTSYSLAETQSLKIFTSWLRKVNTAQMKGETEYENPSSAAKFIRSISIA